jgi:hypothetical protein
LFKALEGTKWRLALPLALLLLVVAGTTIGGVWHHHANAPADTCPICHLDHQALESTPVSIRAYLPAVAGGKPEAQPLDFPRAPASQRILTRGPPA